MRKYIAFILINVLTFSFWNCTSGDDLQFDNELIYLQPDSILNQNADYIIAIGDIQEYTVSEEMFYYLKETANWIRSQQKYFKNISCVLQNGDLTWNNANNQWKFADKAFGYMGDEILAIPSTGNHDYTWGKNSEISDRYSTKINGLVNISSLREQSLEEFEINRIDNIIVPLKVGKDSINIIALEFGPRKEVVSWADSIVRANPEKNYILMTHEWMTRAGERIDKGSYAAMQMPNLSHSTPQEIWEEMVYPNDNILCVLCGHNGFCKYLYSTNLAGREVCQILFNLQYQENGGDGMIQLWEFPKEENVINISVYNTIKREFHPDPETKISIQL